MAKRTHREVKLNKEEPEYFILDDLDFSKLPYIGRGEDGLRKAMEMSRQKRAKSTAAKESREYTVVISQDQDGLLLATVAELAGCYTQAKTMKSLMRRIQETILVCVSTKMSQPSRFPNL